MPPPVRLSKILAGRGIASRSEADRMIERGWVRVDGRIAEPGTRVQPDAHIELLPEAQAHLQTTCTVLVHKPRGYASSPDEAGHQHAMSLLRLDNYWSTNSAHDAIALSGATLQKLRIAGRMAEADTGLLIFTSDTALARTLAETSILEHWLLSFDYPPPAHFSNELIQAIHNTLPALATAVVHEVHADHTTYRLNVATPSLNKGQLVSLCNHLGYLPSSAQRLQRGMIMLNDLPERRWTLLSPDQAR